MLSKRTGKPLVLWKISYVSVATGPDELVDEDVRSICAFAEQHNARTGITGILTFHVGRFAQMLEGPKTELRKLMVRIAADPRHHSVKVIIDGPLANRRYADWSMEYLHPKDFLRDQLNNVIEQTVVMADAAYRTLH